MASSKGWSSLAVHVVISALVAAGTAALLSSPAPVPATPPDFRPGDGATSDDRERLERAIRNLEARVAELDVGRRSSSSGANAAEEGSEAAAGPAAGPDSIPSTKAELLALVDQRVDQRIAGMEGSPAIPAAPKRKLTVDEAADELGLSATQREHLRLVQRETEEEFVEALMGTRDPARIQQQARALRDDPDEKERFIQNVVGNAIRNVGKLATLESRRDRRLGEVLNKEQIEKVRKMEFRPQLIDEETEKLLEDAF